MAVTFTIYAVGTDEDVTQTYYGYLRRESDQLYYDGDDGTFKVFGSLVDGTLDLTENVNQTGQWDLTVPLTAGDTGVYTFIPRDGLDDTLFEAGVERVFLSDGARVLETERDKVLLAHHYGSYNNLLLLDEDGDPVEGATVRVYTKTAFDAGDTDVPIGVTLTDAQGRWLTGIPVTRSETYVVHFHKESAIGPTSTEVIVP